MMKLLKKSNYQVMPWKNGLGSTAQIAIHPPEADFSAGNYLWRVSSATVRAESPFSRFPGCDRWLVILSGEGLLINGFPLLPLSPFHFSGDELVHSELINDAVTDLGIIYRRDKVQASMMLNDLNGNQTLALTKGSHFLFCVQGAFEAEGLAVSKGDTLQAEGPAMPELRVASGSSAKYLHLKLSEF
jgi:environmental stress-induced protein Ves